jgi:Concanavalin A-like lectin/glucanases superfamily
MVQIYPGITIPIGVTIGSAPPPQPVLDGSLIFEQSSLVTTTNTNPLSLGTGNYTVEFWHYWPKSRGRPPTGACFFGKWNTGTSAFEYMLQKSSIPNYLEWVAGSQTVSFPTNNILGDAWTHVAIVAFNSNITIYVDGVATVIAAKTGIQPNNTGAPLSIGGRDNNDLSYSYPGSLTNLRIVPGQAVYRANFTPATNNLTPTQTANQNGNPSQAITSGTALLLTTQTGAGYLDDSSTNDYVFSVLDNGVPVASSSFSPFNTIDTSFTITTTSFTTATVCGDMVNQGGSAGFSLTIVNSSYGVGHTEYTINLSTATGSTIALINLLKAYWTTNNLDQTKSYMFDVTWGAGSSTPYFGIVLLGFNWVTNLNTFLRMSPVNTAYPWQITGGTTDIYTIPPAPTPRNGTYNFPASFNLHTPLYSGNNNWC